MAGKDAKSVELIDRGPWRLVGGFFVGPGSDAWFPLEHDDKLAVPWRVKIRVAEQGSRLVCTGLRVGFDDNEVESRGAGYSAPELTTVGLRAIHLSQILDVIKAHLSLDIYQLHLPTLAELDAHPGHAGVIPEGSGSTTKELLRAKIADGALTVRRGRKPLSDQELLVTFAAYERWCAEGLTPAEAIREMSPGYLTESQIYRRIAEARKRGLAPHRLVKKERALSPEGSP